MPHGEIIGGWEFVIAAYAVVWGGMFAYGVFAALRRRSAQRETELKGENL